MALFQMDGTIEPVVPVAEIVEFTIKADADLLFSRTIFTLVVRVVGKPTVAIKSELSRSVLLSNKTDYLTLLFADAMKQNGFSDPAVDCLANHMTQWNGSDHPFRSTWTYYPYSNTLPKSASYKQPEIAKLPGITEIVKHPVDDGFRGAGCEMGHGRLEAVIISLNDSYHWTRDQIADWLETLDIDLTFKEQQEERIPFPKDTLLKEYQKGEFNISVKEMKAYLNEMKYEAVIELGKNDIIGGTQA